MRARKELVEGGNCRLSWVPNLCSASIPFAVCGTKSSATKLSVTECSILEFPTSFSLVEFKLRYDCKKPRYSNDFETNDAGNCHVISPYSKLYKQDNISITLLKDPITGVLVCEFGCIKYRRFAGYDFFSTIVYRPVLALPVVNNLLPISRSPAQISRCLSRKSDDGIASKSRDDFSINLSA